MRPFAPIFEMAVELKGSEAALRDLLPVPKSSEELLATPDNDWLEAMARVIFQSGFSWKVVENKWPGFQAAFYGFEPGRVALFSDDAFDALLKNKDIIRNGQKLRAVTDNAVFVTGLASEYGSAGKFFAAWPASDFVGLWEYLKKNASRLGGNSGAYFLRRMGWDTPMMSKDVVAALVREGVVDKPPTSKKALAAVQDAFNEWGADSGLPLGQISRILAASAG